MLIKTTTQCQQHCSHCMEEATLEGRHMSLDVYRRALKFAEAIEGPARERIGYNRLMLSGGEPTQNPEIAAMIELAFLHGFMPTLLTNGLWLHHKDLRDRILKYPDLLVQVTNDSRFYKLKPPVVDDPRIAYVDSLTVMIPLGRFAGQVHPELPTRRGPSCFNLRSATRALGDVREAVFQARAKTYAGFSGHCTPSVCVDGSVVMGESRLCRKVGDVDTSMETLTANIINTGSCNRCGLEETLADKYREAIALKGTSDD